MGVFSKTGPDPEVLKLQKQIEELTNELSSKSKRDEEFKRKMEYAISRIREIDSNIADKMDILLEDWNSF